MSEKYFDVRIVEKCGRERILVEFKRVTKVEALRMIGAVMIAHPQGGSNTWVQPRVQVSSGNGWVEQDLELPRKAGLVFERWCDFLNWRMPMVKGVEDQ